MRAWAAAPASNFGWALLPTGDDGVSLSTSEGPNPPALVVNFISYPPPVAAAPTVVNDGAAQRSKVDRATIAFDRAVTLDDGAISLARRDGVDVGVTTAVANPSGDGRTFVLTFAGPGAGGGSLPDGVYDLRVAAAKVRDRAVPVITLAADAAFAFHRLFGDADGDGDVDNADRFDLRSTTNKRVGHAAFKPYFDYDADDDVDNADLFQVRSRRRIAFTGY